MRNLTLLESISVSGAMYGACHIDDYNQPSFVTVDNTLKTDPVLLAMQALNAAVWGCASGMSGGFQGCVMGAAIGATGQTMATVLADTYTMYQNAKNKK